MNVNVNDDAPMMLITVRARLDVDRPSVAVISLARYIPLEGGDPLETSTTISSAAASAMVLSWLERFEHFEESSTRWST